jgi:hypothetical protein
MFTPICDYSPIPGIIISLSFYNNMFFDFAAVVVLAFDLLLPGIVYIIPSAFNNLPCSGDPIADPINSTLLPY